MSKDLIGIGSRVELPSLGKGVVTNINALTLTITFIESGAEEVSKDDPNLIIIERVEPDYDLVSMFDIETTLTSILRKWNGFGELAPIGDKWKKGKLIMQPFDRSLQGKEVPIEAFFHKIVMLRDRLRVMEQRINSNPKLEDDEKVNLQQYLTKIYGSLTTFNVLFRDKDDYFVGEKSS